jgi:hypothetical protein
MIELDTATTRAALDRVRAAFPDEPLPAGTPISTGGKWFDEEAQAHAYANPEAEEVARFFGGRRWNEITPEQFLKWDHASVSSIFLSPLARAYYVPTFLSAFLSVPLDGYAIAVLEHTAGMWTPPQAKTLQIWHTRTDRQKAAMQEEEARGFQEFVGALTPEQKAATAQALAVLAPPFDEPGLENPVRTALDTFWSAYLPK